MATEKTEAMIRALPDTGAIIVVERHGMIDPVFHMIGDIRGDVFAKLCTVVTIERAVDLRMLMAKNTRRIVFDHTWMTAAAGSDRRFDLFAQAMEYNRANGHKAAP
jgi:hypothetical protein